MKNWFQRAILARRWLTFLVLGLSFFVFGVSSFNLFFIARANVELIAEHGWQALVDGGAQQLLEIVLSGYASMASYVLFKVCEARLVRWLLDPP